MIRKTILLITFVLFIMSVTSYASQEVTSESDQIDRYQEDDGFLVDILFEGGSGKAYIESPVQITVTEDGLVAEFVWSSVNYDYMIVDGIRYENENPGGPSTFHVPVRSLDEPLPVIGDTVAMSVPHEIEYTITWEPGNEAAGQDNGSETAEEAISAEISQTPPAADADLEDCGLTLTGREELKYAVGFQIDHYGPYDVITIENSGRFLLVPEGESVPEDLPDDVNVLQKPLDRTYLVSTSAMDLVCRCGALDRVRLSGTAQKDWYVDEAAAAMEQGELIYAGKYRAPDYELILSEGCDLAIENTMIYHEPAVKAKLEELGIPVLVETSSYEENPQGRLEWIKLYGALFDREKEASEFYDKQLDLIETITDKQQDTGKTAAFFHVAASGMINVRRSGDYISQMIEMAGGHYVPENTGDSSNALSTMNIQMEDFYSQAVEADILIYNSTIGGEISSLEDLINKNPLFADFKAVRDRRVYCTKRDLFQQMTGMALFLQDLKAVFSDEDIDYEYLTRVE